MSSFKNAGLRALGTAAMAAVALGGCSGGSSNDDLPLIRATVSIKSVSQGGACESIPVKLAPKELIGKANKYSNNKLMVVEVTMAGPTDENGAPTCNGTGETLPMAPGNWEFSAPLASGTATCVRNIQPDGDLLIALVDGVEGCSANGNGAAAAEAPVDALAPAEGEMPADATDTAPPAG